MVGRSALLLVAPFALAAFASACGTPSDDAHTGAPTEATDAGTGAGQDVAAKPAPTAKPPAPKPPAPPGPPGPPGPNAKDGIKNGGETDVDCGGPGNPKCAVDKTCLVHDDCASSGCAYTGKCASRPSCTVHNGGDTCGAGGAGGLGPEQWESCCATADPGGLGVQLGKYQVTSGRMRAFMDRTKGNVRKFIRDARAAGKITPGAVMHPEWDLYLPTAMEACDDTGTCPPEELSDHFYDQGPVPNEPFVGIWSSAYRQLGGDVFNGEALAGQGCRIDSPGTHTYWMDAATQSKYFGDFPPEYGQDVYDTKALNCVGYLMAQAFCIWDGGRLETFDEWLAAWGADDLPWGPAPKPWGPGSASYFANRFPTATDATVGSPPGPLPDGTSIQYANFNFSYEYPNQVQWDYVVFLNAPGRLSGRGPKGHADVIGSMFEITSDITTDTLDPRTSTMKWTTNGSFEGHAWGKINEWDKQFSLVNKYGKQGLRCAY